MKAANVAPASREAPQLPRTVSRGLSYAESSDVRPQERNIRLCRTESEAFTDELYMPSLFAASSVKKTPKTFLSPHNNLISERLQTANLARSTSPNSCSVQDQSPFVSGSDMASRNWRAPTGPINTAANIRRQQKEEAEQAEYAQHRPQLQREQTKTISPKDALLDFSESEPVSALFPEQFPVGYRSHMGGTEQWPSNNYFSSSNNTAFGAMPTQPFTFRSATPAEPSYTETNFDFVVSQPSSEGAPSEQFPTSFPAAMAAKLNSGSSDATPDFPAALPSMETSLSDLGHAPSSQESIANLAPHRPADTRANTGTYTCTYHGCTRRFDSHNNLQKHKREFHRSQQQSQHRDHTSPTASSASPMQADSPASGSEAGMSNEAIMARNSQAGPHKCTRINPSTNKPCNTVFSRPYDLTRHEDTIHNNRKQKVRCPLCHEEKTFSRHDALTRHMRVVHPEVETHGKRNRRGD